MRRPLLFAALAFGAGDALGLLALAECRARDVPLALVAAAIALAAACLARARMDSVVPWVAACLFFAGLGAGAGALRSESIVLAGYRAPDHPVRFDFELTAAPRPALYGLELSGRIRDCRSHPALRGARLRLTLSGEQEVPPLACGQRWRLWARLEEPTGYRNPGARDLRRLLHRRGIDLRGGCKSPLLLTPLPGARGCGLVHRLRHWLQRGLGRGVEDPELRGLLEAVLLGDRRNVPPALGRALREAGAAHLLAVSGLHVGLLALCLHWLFRICGCDPRVAAATVAAALLLYVGVAGSGAPVVRAVSFALVFLVGRLLGRGTCAANALGVAALLQLAVTPTLPDDLSFRMTFVAAAGILRLAPPLAVWLERRAVWLPGPVRLLVAGSLAAQASLLPEICARFGTVSPAGVLVNLVAVPAAGVLVAVAPALAVLGQVWPAGASLLCVPLVGLLRLLEAACRTGAGASWWVPAPSVPLAVLWLAALFAIPSLRDRVRAVALGGLAILLFLLVQPVGTGVPVPDGRLRVTALDVGQGDAVLLEAGATAVLVDTGGSTHPRFDTGESVLFPVLRHRRRRRLDVLVLSHPDVDHRGGAASLLGLLEVGAVWRPAEPEPDPRWRGVSRACSASATPVRLLSAGHVLKSGPIWFSVLWPSESSRSTGNDRSLVLAAGLEAHRPLVLLPGDIEAPAESRLAGELPPAPVLKVAHHGSRTSSTDGFLEAVRPRVCLISSGRRNPWGHPHPDVLDRLRERHCVVLRTDRQGAQSVIVDRAGRVLIEAPEADAW